MYRFSVTTVKNKKNPLRALTASRFFSFTGKSHFCCSPEDFSNVFPLSNRCVYGYKTKSDTYVIAITASVEHFFRKGAKRKIGVRFGARKVCLTLAIMKTHFIS